MKKIVYEERRYEQEGAYIHPFRWQKAGGEADMGAVGKDGGTAFGKS